MRRKTKHSNNRFLGMLGLTVLFVLLAQVSLEAQIYANIWENGNLDTLLVIRDVTFTGTRWVAVGDDGKIFVSTDSKTWSSRPSPYGAGDHLMGVANGDGIMVAVGRDRLAISSSDGGDSWVIRNPRGSSIEDFYKVAYGNGIFLAVTEEGNIWKSTDGISWAKSSGIGEGARYIAFGNGLFMVASVPGRVWRSADGVSWASAYLGGNIKAVHYGNSLWLAAGTKIWTSSNNGVSWTTRLTLSDYGIIYHLYCVTTAPSSYIAAGEGGLMLNSSDGITWRKGDAKTKRYILGMAYGTGKSTLGAVGTGGPRDPSPELFKYSTHYSPEGGTPPSPLVPPSGNTIKFTYPNGGEVLNPGSQCNIKWTGSITYDKIDIEYYNGSQWVVIVNGTADDGAYSWTVPNISTTKARLWIKGWHSSGNAVDYTDNTFTIGSGTPTPTIEILAPKGGETLTGGGAYDIKWKGSVTFDSVDIEYNNGTQWIVIQNGVTDTGSYTWAVPNISTTKAKIWIKGWHSSGNPVDISDETFSIKPGNTIEILAPNGGENLLGGSAYNITWDSSINFDKVDIEYYNGTQWTVIENGVADTGTYAWTVPQITTTQAKIWMKGWHSSGNAVDYSNNTFTIKPGAVGSITVTSPNGGEVWVKGSTENITWTSSGEVGNVKILYSTNSGANWTTLTASTANDGTYAWTLPNIIANNCLVKVQDAVNTYISDVSNNLFAIGGPPEIILSNARFNFGCLKNGPAPPNQTLYISNGGGGAMNWTASADVTWLNMNPQSGSGGGFVTLSINPTGLDVNTYTGTITISAPNVGNSPQTVDVLLKVIDSTAEQPPFGHFSTPEDGSTGVIGAIPVTGWALDDIGVVSVKIYQMLNGIAAPLDNAAFIEGARPDVEQSYPDYPNSSKAGWGYMLLTNYLADGEATLKVIITDTSGHEVDLGTKTITIDNASSALPFGTIDTPAQGGEASGSVYKNVGWALTPQPNKIPENGSTLTVYVDGVFIGKAHYNSYREDIAALFPGFANSNGSTGYFDLNTTAFDNGVHTISWGVMDNAGNESGIGARFFTIMNVGSSSSSTASRSQAGIAGTVSPETLSALSFDYLRPLRIKTGYSPNIKPVEIYPDKSGIATYEIKELDRVQIQLNRNITCGYLVVGNEFRPLPIGSKLDLEKGIFYWQVGPGFSGDYELVFMGQKGSSSPTATRVLFKINAKHSEKNTNLQLEKSSQ